MRARARVSLTQRGGSVVDIQTKKLQTILWLQQLNFLHACFRFSSETGRQTQAGTGDEGDRDRKADR